MVRHYFEELGFGVGFSEDHAHLDYTFYTNPLEDLYEEDDGNNAKVPIHVFIEWLDENFEDLVAKKLYELNERIKDVGKEESFLATLRVSMQDWVDTGDDPS